MPGEEQNPLPGMSVMLCCARKLNVFSCVVDSYISSKGKIQSKKRERERQTDRRSKLDDGSLLPTS
jgi:hypothetical protein